MTIQDIRKRWHDPLHSIGDKEYFLTSKQLNDVDNLIRFAEATIAYFHAEPSKDHEAWKAFKKAREELEGE
jgi:hypothetical protein